MRLKLIVPAAAVGIIASAGLVAALSQTSESDTENCTTHDEYDRTDVLMSPATVESIYDVNGQFVDTANPDTFARTYRTCWAPGDREVIVRYGSDNGLSISWDVRDVT
jgi:hypothetical protein